MKISKEKILKLLKLLNYEPRAYQKKFINGLVKAVQNKDADGVKTFSLMWARRHGKDRSSYAALTLLALLIPGTYYYFFPTKTACIENVFEGMDGGEPWLEFIPKELVEKVNRTRSFIKLKGTGSVIRFKGTDKDQIEDLRGFSVQGAVISEAAQHNENIWPVIMPALEETNGFLIYNSTPNGRNWYWRLHQDYEKTDRPNIYYADTITAEKTGVMSDTQLREAKRQCEALYGDDTLYQQEYFCRADVGALGAIYHDDLNRADKEHRLSYYGIDTRYPVHTFWDLGRDGTAIWYVQVVGTRHTFIDYSEIIDSSAEEYVKELKRKGYTYGEHYLPWDADKKNIHSEHTFKEIFRNLLIINKLSDTVNITARTQTKNDLIFATKNVFRHAHIDREKCEKGLTHLELYHRSFDTKRRIYSKDPVHDQHSHAADAFGIWALNYYLLRQHEHIENMDTYGDGLVNQEAELWEWDL